MAFFDRFDICEAYAQYDILYGPTEYAQRLREIDFRLGCLARLENMNENAKEIFGRLVIKHNRLYTAYGRYQKRNPKAPQWPGTYNMPQGERAWLKSVGALEACEVMV